MNDEGLASIQVLDCSSVQVGFSPSAIAQTVSLGSGRNIASCHTPIVRSLWVNAN